MKRYPKLCYSITDTEWPIKLEQTGRDRFTVTYGKEVTSGLDELRAAKEFGFCLMHALRAAGHVE